MGYEHDVDQVLVYFITEKCGQVLYLLRDKPGHKTHGMFSGVGGKIETCDFEGIDLNNLSEFERDLFVAKNAALREVREELGAVPYGTSLEHRGFLRTPLDRKVHLFTSPHISPIAIRETLEGKPMYGPKDLYLQKGDRFLETDIHFLPALLGTNEPLGEIDLRRYQ